MKKSTTVLIIIAVLVVIGAVWVFNTNRAVAPENGVIQKESSNFLFTSKYAIK